MSASPQHGLVSRMFRRVGGVAKSGLAAVGLVAIGGAYLEYKRLFPKDKESEEKDDEKKVLVIPFHKFQLVERKDRSFSGILSSLDRGEDEDPVQVVEVRELVELLHHAASDPTITAVYGIFGHGGMGLAQAGWAQLEEVRNALKIVKESHRRHHEPNLDHQMQVIPRVQSKPLYAYADTFVSFADPSNKEYYLASIFTHIHMQKTGELNLFGMMSQQFFLRDLLDKYGIQLHVFKHGIYKNAPNMFTHSFFTKFHRENVTNIVETINEGVCDDVTNSRSKALLTTWLTKQSKGSTLWQRIQESGTFPADSAWKAGLIDYLPKRDPLPDLVESNTKSKEKANTDDEQEVKTKKDEIAEKWKLQETDFERFKADKAITFKEYAKQITTKKKATERRQKWHEYLAEKPSLKEILPKLGISPENTDDCKDRIALLHVNGTIGDNMANKLVKSIRKIREDKDTKALVVRVASPGGSIVACETIRQELKALDKPVVVSFGNVSASGGYYISSCADRIFSLPKTITGSIGVFGIRMDLLGLARKYDINVDHVTTGDLSGTYMPFHPMSKKMKNNMAAQIDRYYDQFKSIVSEGRDMSNESVETIAQGRVWTGDQAKTIGLVDELGGLHRALAYARRTYTSNVCDDNSDVIVWPKKRSVLERLAEARENRDGQQVFSALYEVVFGEELSFYDQQNFPRWDANFIDWLIKSPVPLPSTLSGILLTADENSAIRCLLESEKEKMNQKALLSDSCYDM